MGLPDDEQAETADDPPPPAYCVRDGKRLPVSEGMEAYAGDVVETGADGAIAIAFMDSCAVTLRESTTLRIDDYAYPDRLAPTYLSLESGSAFFDIQPRPENAHFFVRTKGGEVDVKGTKFEILSSPYGNDFKTTVAVTKGKVTITPKNATSVWVEDGNQAVVSIKNYNIPGWDTSNPELKKGNISKDMLKVLKKTALCDVMVTVTDKKGQVDDQGRQIKSVKIKSWNKNPDGTKTYIRLTEITGEKIRMSTTVKSSNNKVISRIIENRNRIVTKGIDGNLQIRHRTVDGTGTATIRDRALKKVYMGSVVTMADGTVYCDTKAKDGTRMVYSTKRLAGGTIVTIKTVFANGSDQGTQYTDVRYANGRRDSWWETVTSVLRTDGDFVSVTGVVDYESTAKLPPGAPEVLSTTDIVIPDTTETPPDDVPISP
jgi:hypothetical protein